jgi:hypothetical protein
MCTEKKFDRQQSNQTCSNSSSRLESYSKIRITCQVQPGKGNTSMSTKKKFSTEEAKQIGEALGIGWSAFDVEQFRVGLNVELEHGTIDAQTNVSNDDPLVTGKIALAHLNEFPDYYTRLSAMEKEADDYWANAKAQQ